MTAEAHSPAGPPSDWVVRWSELLSVDRPILDLACGRGRHARWLLARGHEVVAVDRDLTGLDGIAGHPRLTTVTADLEAGQPFPFTPGSFGGAVVTNYLYRPLLDDLVASIGWGGALLYETFAAGNEQFGRPSNPEFLLRPGELLDVVHGRLRVVAYEDVTVATPRPAAVQRIAAVRADGPDLAA